ncbi:MAG TPA: peptide chain release factor N(5)-glutamine methyltransferase [Candidatus Cybelea sp.]|nr:peptide chain release factor N(5)-glutamine methyltransferase [Candidatus Cybelea sp.]
MTDVATLLAGSAATRNDARLLLAHVLARDPAWIVAHGDAPVSARHVSEFEQVSKRRGDGEPIAYITGFAGFYGREFIVNRHVLVPRPETEHLVDEALAFIRGSMRVLDVGTGCGALACTIAAETNAWVDATDSSEAALAIATENACRLGVSERCRFHLGDLAQPVQGERFDLVIANLPYIPTVDLPKSPEPASFEPCEALDGGPDGLRLYRRVIAQLTALLGNESLLLFEAAPPAIHALEQMVGAAFPRFRVSVEGDYAGLARYVKGRAPLEA